MESTVRHKDISRCLTTAVLACPLIVIAILMVGCRVAEEPSPTSGAAATAPGGPVNAPEPSPPLGVIAAEEEKQKAIDRLAAQVPK